MRDAYLKPPARFSHGLLLAVVLLLAIGLAISIGQQPTLYLGLVTTSLFLGGFWAFSQRAVWLTAVGTVAVLLGGIGILLTALWALVGASVAGGDAGWVVSLGVILALLGAVVAIVGDVVPATITDQDGPTIVALVYGEGLALGAAVAITSLQLGLTSLLGESTSDVTGVVSGLLQEAATLNPVTRAGSAALLSGACFWYLTRLDRLPLGRRLRQGIAIRLAQEWDRPRTETSPDGASSDEPAISDALGFGARLPTILRFVGAALFYLGVGAMALGLTPEFQSTATTHPIATTLGSMLGPSAVLQRSLARLLLGLVGLRVVHAIIWWALTVEWAAYGHRLGYVNGSLVVLLGGALAGRPTVEFLLDAPALKYVPMTDAGPAVVATASGLSLAESGVSGLEIQHQPELFDAWFPALVSLTGPAVVGVCLLAVAIALAVIVLVVATMLAGGARLTRPGAGIGLLFLGAAGATVIGASELLAFAAGAGALLAWELYTYGAGLHRQLDPEATTLTAELVHLGVSVLLIGVAIGITLLASRASRLVPVPQTRWQLFVALVLSLAALLLGLLYLGLHADAVAEPSGS